jgi:hypothetical protein
MRRILVRGVVAAMLSMGVAALISSAQPAFAQERTSGAINGVFPDPSDFVILLDRNGKCGSPFFHIQRENLNFKEVVAVSLTAFAMGKAMTVFVTSCSGDRNIISHGFTVR